MNLIIRHMGIAACYVFALVASPSSATIGLPGTLDPFWATGSPFGAGKVVTAVGAGTDVARAVALQPDGKVLLAGYCSNGANNDFCLVRYLPNGTLDTSWNGTGSVMTAVGSLDDVGNAMVLQPDGKVLVAGACWNGTNNDICSARFLPNGALDTTWSGSGTLITPVGSSNSHAYGVILQPDGKVLLGGRCAVGVNFQFCAVRYLPDGTIDATWNGSGKVITPISGTGDEANAIVLQPDGKVLLGGYCRNGVSEAFCAVRYLTNGTLDTTWNVTGKVLTPVGTGSANAYAMTLQPDGKVLLAGNCALDFCAVRYLPNGTLDLTWNSTGKVITPMGAAGDYGDAIVLQPDGKVLLAGYCYNGPNTEFCSVRYLPHGVPDPTWNGTGTVFTAITVGTVANAMTLQPDGKLLLAGYCYTGVTTDFCAARYDGGPFGYQNCKPDLDGDGLFLATTDALMYTRVALGITGPAVVAGITFASGATRNTWPLIREYLITQCGMSLVP